VAEIQVLGGVVILTGVALLRRGSWPGGVGILTPGRRAP
jgi:hypothetical protein